MASEAWERIKDFGPDELAEESDIPPGSNKANLINAAFQRLQTKAAMEASAAQIGAAADASTAAKAAKDTADYTRESARWMKYSVYVLALSGLLTLGISIVSLWMAAHPPSPTAAPPVANQQP